MENRNIEQFFSENLLIDVSYGISALNSYLNDLALLQSGAKFSDLGYSEKREKQRPLSRGNIQMLTLNGVMRMDDSISTRGVRSLVADIEAANANSMVQGILLEINSGGGEALAGSFLNSAIAESVKPVVSYGHYVGSAAYLGAIASREVILSSDMAKAGSIGAMITINKTMLEKYKAAYLDIYATQSPDKNKEFRGAMESNMEFIQESVDKAAELFQNAVMSYRKVKDKEKALSGGMFYANEAKELGLIDGIGSLNYAVNRLNFHIKYN